jgi:hypothetical protein
MERDAAESDAVEMTHGADMSRAFGRGGRSPGGEGTAQPTDELTTRARIAPIFAMFCIIVITVACVALHTLGLF